MRDQQTWGTTDPAQRRFYEHNPELGRAMEKLRINGEKRHREMREDNEAIERHVEASGRILDELRRSL